MATLATLYAHLELTDNLTEPLRAAVDRIAQSTQAMSNSFDASSKAIQLAFSGMDQAFQKLQDSVDAAVENMGKSGNAFADAWNGPLAAAYQPLQDLGAAINSVLIPAFTSLPQPVQTGIVALAEIGGAASSAIIWIGEFTGGLETILGAAGRVVTSTGLLRGAFELLTKGGGGALTWLGTALPAAFGTVTSAIGSAVGAIGGLGGVVAFLTNPITLIVAALAGVVVAVRYFTGSWTETWNVLKWGVPPLHALETAWKGLQSGMVALAPVWREVTSLFDDLWVITRGVSGYLGAEAVSAITSFGNSVKSTVNDALGWMGEKLTWLKDVLVSFGSSAASVANDALGWLGEKVSSLREGFSWLGGTLASFGQKAAAELWKVVEGLDKIFSVSKVFKGIGEWVGGVIDWFRELRGEIRVLANAFRALDVLRNSKSEQPEPPPPALPPPPAMFRPAPVQNPYSLDKALEISAHLLEGEDALRRGFDRTGTSLQVRAKLLVENDNAAKKHTETVNRLKDLQQELFGLKDIETANQWMQALGGVENVTKLTTEKKERLNQVLAASREAYLALKHEVPQALDDIYFATMKPIPVTENLQELLKGMTTLPLAPPPGIKKLTEELDNVAPSAMKAVVETCKIGPAIENTIGPAVVSTLGTVTSLSQGFTNIGRHSEGAFATVATAIGTVTSAMDGAMRSGGKFWDALASKDGLANAKYAVSDLANALVGGFGAVAQATSSDSMGQNILGGAIAGATSGASIAGMAATMATGVGKGAAVAGIWGAAAGAVVGIFIAVFRGREARREMEIVGKEWGMEVSKGLYDKIKATQKEMGFGRVEATLWNMDKMISEAGGLNEVNFDKFLGKLRDVFSAFEGGAFTAAQATHVLNENFSTFADQVVNSGTLASTKFQEILTLNAASGLYAQEVLDFVSARTAVVAEGLAAMSGPLLAEIETWKKATEEGKVSAEQQAAFIAKSAAEIDNLGIIALGAFGAARASGLSFYEAVQAMGPGLDALIKAQEQLGITGTNSALNTLTHFRDLANEHGTLIQAAEALNGTMLGLSQIGGLNAESLAAMEQQGLTTFERLKAAGFSQNEALAVMADYLNTAASAHMQLGIPIDENTGKLIQQADELGLLSQDGKSMTDTLKGGFDSVVGAINAMITTLGGVPYQVQSISDAIKKIPTKIPFEYEVRNPDRDDLPQYSRGSGGLRNFGAGTLVELHGNEAVLTEEQYRNAMATPEHLTGVGGEAWMDRIDDLGMGGQTIVTIDARGALVGDYASQQRFKQMVEEALVGRVRDQRQIGIGRSA